jgi:hypothetical protein
MNYKDVSRLIMHAKEENISFVKSLMKTTKHMSML